MGVYTGLAKLGTKRWESRSYVRREVSDTGERPPIEETRFICPECRERYPYDDDCVRCGRALVDRTVALPAVHEGSPRLWPGLPGSGSPAVYTLVVVSVGLAIGWIPLVEYFEGTGTGGVLAVLGAAAAAALVLPAVAWMGAHVIGYAAAVRARRRALAAMRAMRVVPIAELPAECEEPVRVRGTVQFETLATAVRVRVCDETGAVTLPENMHVRARVADGDAVRSVDSVRDGDEVDMVCRGRRVACAGDGYRVAESELEIDVSAPVEVWVERRRG